MKKYQSPEFRTIEMESSEVMTGSNIAIKDESTDDTFNFSSSRNRGQDWTEYEQ
jgi:hypothetical protein